MSKAKATEATLQDAHGCASEQATPCQECTHFAIGMTENNLGGSDQYLLVKTCQDCGKVRRETMSSCDQVPCQHLNVVVDNSAGSSTKNNRIICADCGFIVYEEWESVFRAQAREPPLFFDEKFIGSSQSSALTPELPKPELELELSRPELPIR